MVSKESLIGIVIGVLLVLVAKCGGNTYEGGGDIITTDTISVTKIDTVFFPEKVYVTEVEYINKPEFIYVSDSISKNVYRTDIDDSLISGVVTSEIYTDGTLFSQSFSYTPKFPKYIKESVTETITNGYIDNSINIYAGASIGFGSVNSISPNLSIQLRNKNIISAGYDIINKSVILDFKIKINNKKN